MYIYTNCFLSQIKEIRVRLYCKYTLFSIIEILNAAFICNVSDMMTLKSY